MFFTKCLAIKKLGVSELNANIKYYPKSYKMSDELKAFLTVVTENEELQKQLYATDKLSEVTIIANELGFNIKSAEILQAQAGRVLAILHEQSDDLQNLISGIKPKTGAQWGRGGTGWLDRAGYWLNELSTPASVTSIEGQINQFLDKAHQDSQLKKELLNTKKFDELAELLVKNNFNLTAVNLLEHQAQKILLLNEKEAEKVADN